jgi:hypothetical protein
MIQRERDEGFLKYWDQRFRHFFGQWPQPFPQSRA